MSLLTALEGKNLGRPPVWFMRQAGRYMPQYRAIRSKHSFMTMVKTPDLACQVTLLPVDHLGVDAAILFSDILVILEALGVKVDFVEGVGPVIENPITSPDQIASLQSGMVAERLWYVFEAIRELRGGLKVPLIGFCGAPFTVASYLIEGGSSKEYKKIKKWMLTDPESFHLLLDKITQASIDYLVLQQKAGAQALQIFDSWANILGHAQFQEFSLRYIDKICSALTDIPVIIFSKGSSVFAKDFASLKCSCISLDSNSSLKSMRKTLPKICLQGNLDPDILYAPPHKIKQEVDGLLAQMKGDPAYIFNLGHGCKPDMSFDRVKHCVECVQNGP